MDDDGMTEYGAGRIAKGLVVGFASSGHGFDMRIDDNGNVVFTHEYGSFVVPANIKRSVSEGMLIKREKAGTE